MEASALALCYIKAAWAVGRLMSNPIFLEAVQLL